MFAAKNEFSSLKGKELLITGGAGMLGSSIAQFAVPAGAKVTVLDNMAPLYGGNLYNLHGIAAQVRFRQR